MRTTLDLFSQDLTNRIFSAIGLSFEKRGSVSKRIVLIWALTWLPVAVLSAIGGVALSAELKESFLIDYAAYAQFFVGIPLFILAEYYVNSAIGDISGHFISSGLVVSAESKDFETLINGINRWGRSPVYDIILYFVSLGITQTWFFPEITNGNTSWHAPIRNGIEHVSFAGMWAAIVSVPLFNFFLFRWLWKVVLWIYFLGRASRFDLRLNALHPDRVAGLGFLQIVQIPFSLLIFATGSVIAATVFYQITVSDNGIMDWAVVGPLVSYVVVAPIVFMVPLLFFFAKLLREKQRAHLEISENYLIYLNHRRSRGVTTESEQAAIASLASTLNAPPYENIDNMRLVPLDVQSMAQLFISAIAPMLPLITKIPKIAEFLAAIFPGK